MHASTLLLTLLSIGVVRRLHANLGDSCYTPGSCDPIPHVECRRGEGFRSYCVCAAGFMQNKTAEYTKQECVRVVAKTKSHGDPCTWGECLEQYVCRHGHCACPLQTPNFVPMTKGCVGSSMNGSCYDAYGDTHFYPDSDLGLHYVHGSCVDLLFCDEDKCICHEEVRPHWHEPSSKCESPYAGERCSEYSDDKCHNSDESHLHCVKDPEHDDKDREICVCAVGYPDWNMEKRQCVQRRLGETCASSPRPYENQCIPSTQCVDGTCQCTQATPVPDHVTKSCSAKFKYGQSCTSDDCEADDLSCQNKVCLCKNTSLEFHGGVCASRAQKPFGGSCGGDNICNAERGLVCEGGSCKCEAGRTWTQNICQLDPKSCTTDSQNACDASKGLHCDVEARMCMCPDGKQPSKSGSCKSMVGQPCLENGVLRHDLCASDICIGGDTVTVALAGLCACADFNGVKYTWSSEPGQACVPDYFGLPCNPSEENRDCRFDNSRPKGALSCLKMNDAWFCACAKDKTHFQGFCAVVDRTHGERCDPRGVEPTCRLDPKLTLVCDEGMCRCRNRAVTSANETIEYASTTWYEDTKQCELGREGAACAANVQCANGECDLPAMLCQKPTEKPKSGVGVLLLNIPILIPSLYFVM